MLFFDSLTNHGPVQCPDAFAHIDGRRATIGDLLTRGTFRLVTAVERALARFF